MEEFDYMRCAECAKLQPATSAYMEKNAGHCRTCFSRKFRRVPRETLSRVDIVRVVYWYFRHNISLNPGWRWYLHPVDVVAGLWACFDELKRTEGDAT